VNQSQPLLRGGIES